MKDVKKQAERSIQILDPHRSRFLIRGTSTGEAKWVDVS
jgi:hypothetical protein